MGEGQGGGIAAKRERGRGQARPLQEIPKQAMARREVARRVGCFGMLLAVLCASIAPASGYTAESETRNASPINVTARLDRNVITIGDKIRYELIVEALEGTTLTFPQFGDTLSAFTIKDSGQSSQQQQRDGTVITTRWYILQTFTTGTHEIPPALVRYKLKGQDQELTISAPQLAVRVESLLEKEGQATDIRDIKPPVELPADRRALYLATALALAAIAVTLSLIRIFKRRRRGPIRAQPVEMPWEIALRELAALQSNDLVKRGRIEEFYVALSSIVRHYLEHRFALRAPEMTTEEFLLLMSRDETLVKEHKQLVREFLAHCDLVKFARYGPSHDEIDSVYGSAFRLVQETIPHQTQEPGEPGKGST